MANRQTYTSPPSDAATTRTVGIRCGNDGEQSTRCTGQATGTALADSVTYDPFGQVTTRTGGSPALGFQGEWTDAVTGKVNMLSRWYQPDTGTFTSRDTATLGLSPSVLLNSYA